MGTALWNPVETAGEVGDVFEAMDHPSAYIEAATFMAGVVQVVRETRALAGPSDAPAVYELNRDGLPVGDMLEDIEYDLRPKAEEEDTGQVHGRVRFLLWCLTVMDKDLRAAHVAESNDGLFFWTIDPAS